MVSMNHNIIILSITTSVYYYYYHYLPSCGSEDVFLLICSKFDLYSKADSVPDVEAVSPYYEELIAKYCPGELSW